jgi:integrase
LEIDVRKTVNLAAAAAVAEHVPAPLTLAELVKAWAVACLGDGDLRLRKWTEGLGHQSAWSITSEMLEAAVRLMLASNYKPATVNRDLSTLGTVYRWAKEERLSPRGFRSPTLGVRRKQESMRRVTVTDAELEDLRRRALAFRDRRFGLFVHLLIDTGARKSELLERTWSEVDLERCEILCPTTKNGAPRVLHFRPETGELIKRIAKTRRPDALVFEGRVPGQKVSFRWSWEKTVKAIGRPDLHIHDVRHACTAQMLRAGVTGPIASQVNGHSLQVMMQRYGHLETGPLRQAKELAWRAEGASASH